MEGPLGTERACQVMPWERLHPSLHSNAQLRPEIQSYVRSLKGGGDAEQ